MPASYDTGLVLLSVLVAMAASYAALALAGRVTQSRGRAAQAWLGAGAAAMGTGIWAMHFIGMLAFRLPIRIAFELQLTLASLLVAIFTSGFALALVSRAQRLSAPVLMLGGLVMGAGICAMHYSGMAAMRMSPPVQYDPLLFFASIGIAVSASMVALWLAFAFRSGSPASDPGPKVLAAVVMGLAIAGMHYTGMAAANFVPGSFCTVGPADELANVGGEGLGHSLAAVVLALLAMAITASIYDSRLASQTAKMLENVEAANLALRREAAEREHAQAVLAESERRLSNLLGNVELISMMLNSRAEVTYCNDYLLRLTGWSREEALGSRWVEKFLPESNRAEVQRVFDELMRELPEAWHHENHIITRTGELRMVRWHNTVLRNTAGTPIGTASLGEDVTEMRRAESELQARTASLEEANRELEQFAIAGSHTLQEPLRAISGFAALLKKDVGGQLGPEADGHIRMIQESALQMRERLDGLLEMSLLGRRGLRLHPVDFGELARLAMMTVRQGLADAAMHFEVSELPTLEVDRDLMLRLLEHLFSNAIRFQPRRPPHVSISAQPREEGWEFRVRDEGIGIDPQHHDKLFRMFQRLNPREERPGLGLGLAACKKIVTLHGGRIGVESAPEQGSTFIFYIPRTVPASRA